MFAVNIFTKYHYQFAFNIIMLDAVFTTNLREGREFLQMYITDPDFLLLSFILVCILILLRYIFLAILKRKLLSVFLFVMCFAVSTGAFIREFNFGLGGEKIKNSVYAFNVSSMLHQIYANRTEYNIMLKEVPDDTNIIENQSTIPYIIFILGESTCRNHMSLYGYELATDPELEKRHKNEKLYVFSDIISPNATTNLVLQKLFTFYRNDSEGQWFSYMNIFQILRDSGYYVYWISNQESETIITAKPSRLFSGLCDEKIFTDKFRDLYEGIGFYDEKILPLLDEALKSDHEKNFYLIHLLGTHMRYNRRYPEQYEKFSVYDEKGHEGISYYQKNIRATYDNSVLYNDFIVNEIIKRFENKNAIVIYMSDHGEEVYDVMNIMGHNEGILDRNMIEVPFIIWLSEKFSKEYPELEKRISESINRPYMTDDMIHTLLDIAGITTKEYDPEKSIINASFDSDRKRIYAGKVYNKEKGLQED